MKKVLEDIRIVDLTHVWYGPYSTMLLASLGAEVIKIEPPWGEGRRGQPQPGRTSYGGASTIFHYLNLGKKGMAINLKDERGLKIFKELVKKSDVVIQNFSPGTMEKMGLGYDILKEINPRIIYAALSGFGQTGPYSKRGSYAVIAEAISGFARSQGNTVDLKGPPMRFYGNLGDLGPAVFAALSIIAAIRFRDQTGKGQMIDVAQADCMVSLNPEIVSYTISGMLGWERRRRTYTRPARGGYGLSGIKKTKDGWVQIAGFTPQFIDNFKKMLGVEEVTQEVVEEWAASHTREEVVEKLVELDVPVAPIYDLDETVNDPHLITRDMFIEVEHPKAGKLKVINFPVKLSESPGEIPSAAPLIGQHNKEILTNLLGYTEEETDQLLKDSVIVIGPQKTPNDS